ncbi:uncharacterized protein HMPREF1541_10270 [Cyphellophora europaea CBS 101466]|uniref:BTB domain-containing protein n=1 Tax=Cyphellophora europaea (strain CBS 101466) TaxID=1220924 RepID=W2S7I9_CYPE1|nr:uncharacterized protein HMPREF1541_10270 [Cyphellophora europaea CBS 101466]ETN44600.1 hypothetical protein HMPREF1541_10270 [Cyphellophora europaea CBS 101466]
MVTNGMRESVDLKTHLKEIELEVFTLFLEYAYKGVYRAPIRSPKSSPSQVAGQGPQVDTPKALTKVQKHCIQCGSRDFGSGPRRCSILNCITYGGRKSVGPYCGFCGRYNHTGYSLKACSCTGKSGSEPNAKDSGFSSLVYALETKSHAEARTYLENLDPPVRPTNAIRCHAKLYVFAQQWMIEPLKKLCLHKLHRDLQSLAPADNFIEIIRLLSYTYENTSTVIDKELRELVSAYAMWKAKVLVKLDDFKAFLRTGGEVVEDLTCQLAEASGS